MANEIRLRNNNISGTTTDNPLTAGATTINSPGFVDLPAVTTSNHLILILDPLEVAGAAEIVQVTAHTASASSVTVVRGFDTTTPRQHNLGTTWFHGPVASDYNFTDIAALSTNRPAAPTQGQLIYETDTNKYVGRAAGAVWQDVAPLGAWATWTPVITQSVNVTYTNNGAQYFKSGRLVHLRMNAAVTGAGTAANAVLITGLPFVAASTAFWVSGVGHIFDSSAVDDFTGIARFTGVNNTIGFLSTRANGSLGAASFTAGLAASDQVDFTLTYEAAS